MNEKIQEGIDSIVRLFTRKTGEVGIYAGMQTIAYIVALLPVILTGGLMYFGLANMSYNTDISSLFSGLYLMYAMIGVSALLLILVVLPFLISASITLVNTTIENLSENVSLMIKNAIGKWSRVLGTLGLIWLLFIGVGIVMSIVMYILGLIFGFIPFVGAIILALIMLALYIGVLYFACPLYFSIFDAVLTNNPVVASIVKSLTKTDKYRLPLLLTIIATLLVTGIVNGILLFLLRLIPFIGMYLGIIVVLIVFACGTLALLAMIHPYYKEYSETPL